MSLKIELDSELSSPISYVPYIALSSNKLAYSTRNTVPHFLLLVEVHQSTCALNQDTGK